MTKRHKESPADAAGSVWGNVTALLRAGERFALATVLARTGSAPREVGATLLVCADGKAKGTIGGGILDAAAQESALLALHTGRSFCRTVVLTNAEASEEGLACGGRIEILLDALDGASPQLAGLAGRMESARRQGKPIWLVRSIRSGGKGEGGVTGIGLWDGGILDPGTLGAEAPAPDTLQGMRPAADALVWEEKGARILLQPVGAGETVFLFGAGHVAQALAVLCSHLGFRTVVVDDRKEFANRLRFPQADEIRVVGAFGGCVADLGVSAAAFLVIVTRGHAYDGEVLAQALKTPARYIGMIGSRAKRTALFAELACSGFAEADLARVSCPIGLDIGARTPAEIAVSIAGELIAVRAGKTAEPKP